MGTVQSPAARKDRLDTRYCDREGREFQETHQLQTLRVCSSRVYKKIQILDSSTSFVKEVYTKMYSIYTAARTTPSSQMLLYSSLCTKRKKKKKQVLQWRCTAAREPVGRSNVYKSVCKKRGSAAKGDAGLPRGEGRPGKRRENLERSHKLREVGMSDGAMHPWEGHDPGKYGMFTVVLYCFVVDSFCFFVVVANKPTSPGWAASLCSLPASVFRFTFSQYNPNTNKKNKKNTTQ